MGRCSHGLLRAGKAADSKSAISPADVAEMPPRRSRRDQRQGQPASDHARRDPSAVEAAASRSRQRGTTGVLAATAEAAQAGAVSTKELVAKVGRASRLGERTLGHQDPGATSVSIILRVAADALADANAPAANADTGR